MSDSGVEIDMERKEELIMAKKLRACRVTILPKAPPGKCFMPEVVPAKLRPKKEPVQISMTQAPKKPNPGAPSPAAIAAATNPVALRYWNQCLANSSKGSQVPVPKEEKPIQAPFPQQTDPTFPPWVTSLDTAERTPAVAKVERSEMLGAKPVNIVVPDMTQRVAARPVSHPPALTIRRGSNTSAVLEAVLKDDEEEKNTFTRLQKPWQLHNQRQVATFAHQGRERKPGAGHPRHFVKGAESKGSHSQIHHQGPHLKQNKDGASVDSTNPLHNLERATKETAGDKKSDKVEQMAKVEPSDTFPKQNVVSSEASEKNDGQPKPLDENSEPSKDAVFTETSESIIKEEENVKLKRNGISDAIDTKLEKEDSANNETSTMVRRALYLERSFCSERVCKLLALTKEELSLD